VALIGGCGKKSKKDQKKSGKVEWFDRGKGYGRIIVSGSKESIFCHISEFPGFDQYRNQRHWMRGPDSRRWPNAGDNVSFIIGDNGRGPCAEEIFFSGKGR